ncbi:DUF1983 domain-containing protein [Paramixta manurensis]|uniref:DUF1983 domain-containing protein n=1 Tax=Paramixta manurensis TaxID=2740817 RepID=A0A6M8UCE0_9GAMM|nr:DUF1983 domain-containing protein [Erwiniaceae bacterium PD-1]
MSSKNKKTFRAGRDQAAVAENIEILTGQRGNGLDRAITLRDLGNLKLADLRQGAGGVYQPIPGGGNDMDDPGAPPQMPTQPQNFQVNGGFAAVLLEWDMPTYRGHSLTEIYRNPEDNLANAVLVATSAATVYGDPVDPGFVGYYWIRFVNTAGVPGPYNAAAGTLAKTNPDVDAIVDLINNEINDSPLIGELGGKVDDNAAAIVETNQKVQQIDTKGGQAFQAMWDAKASASGISAGIGIVAGKDASGNPISQVAISANQFFVFDPNNPTNTGAYLSPFAIEGNKTVITEAAIQQATIKILNAQTIIADQVKAGISISSPTITSANLRNGPFTVDPNGNLKIGAAFSVDANGNLQITNRFRVDNNGNVTIRNSTSNLGLVWDGARIIVYDESASPCAVMGKKL